MQRSTETTLTDLVFPAFHRKHSGKWLVASLFFLSIFVCECCIAQSSGLLNISADSLRGKTINDIFYRELIGNVRIQQENVHISCDRALQNMSANTVELIGNVVITQDTLILKTDRGMYYGDEKLAYSSTGIYLHDGHITLTAVIGRYETSKKIAHFVSRVTVDEPSTSIFAETLQYDRDSSKAIATNNVFVLFKKENAVISADSVIHYVERKTTFFPTRPRLWQIDSVVVRRDSITNEIDSLRLDTLSIVSQRMEAYRDTVNLFLAQGDVEIVRGELSARCQIVRYLRNDSLVILQTNPILWYELNQITGDSIAVFLANGSVVSLHVIGNAFSVSQSKPSEKDTLFPPGRYDQAKGGKIFVFFEDDKPIRTRIETSAMSLYYLYDDRALNGVRKESSDLIHIDFVDGKANTIRSIGGIEGTYYPEKLVTGAEDSFNLEGFVWRTDRPIQPQYPDKIRKRTSNQKIE